MPVHDWSKVDAGTFHAFQTSWIAHLMGTMNRGVLPKGYYALAEQHAGLTIPDAPAPYRADRNDEAMSNGKAAPVNVRSSLERLPAASVKPRWTLAVRRARVGKPVALVEIVSRDFLDRFDEKARPAVSSGIHLLISTSSSPDGRASRTRSRSSSSQTHTFFCLLMRLMPPRSAACRPCIERSWDDLLPS
jgi:hypothetical protein